MVQVHPSTFVFWFSFSGDCVSTCRSLDVFPTGDSHIKAILWRSNTLTPFKARVGKLLLTCTHEHVECFWHAEASWLSKQILIYDCTGKPSFYISTSITACDLSPLVIQEPSAVMKGLSCFALITLLSEFTIVREHPPPLHLWMSTPGCFYILRETTDIVCFYVPVWKLLTTHQVSWWFDGGSTSCARQAQRGVQLRLRVRLINDVQQLCGIAAVTYGH